MSDILTGTPADLTYAHDLVRQAWMVVWAVTSGALVVILGWMGLSFIMAEHLGTRQTGWREMVPRLVLGLVAAASSLWWCALVLDVADAVSGFIAVSLDVTAGDMLRSTLRTLMTAVNAGSVGMALLLAVLYLVYGFFVLYVIVQMVLRLALIDILLALAPIALGLWILPHTAGWGRHWLRLFMTTVFQQAIQLIALALGLRLPQRVRGDRRLRAGAGPDLEAPHVPGLRLHGNPRPVDARQSRHLRLLALDALLRHEPALVADAFGPDHRLGGGRRGGRAGRHGGGSDGGQRGRFGRRQRPQLGGFDGDPIGRRGRRRRRAQEQRRVAAIPRRRRRDVQLNGAYGHRPIETSKALESREEKEGMEQLTQTISNLVGILLGVVGAIGVGFFIYGAYLYLTASGAPHQMERGKSAMMTALAGIVLALVAYGVVELVMNAVVDPGIDIDDVLPEPEAPDAPADS